MSTPMWKEYWPAFEKEMKERLQTGYLEYGDGSFLKEPLETVEEVIEETMDIVGWSFILRVRLERLKKAISALPKD